MMSPRHLGVVRYLTMTSGIIALAAFVPCTARAAESLGKWLYSAAALDTNVKATRLSRADYLGGSSMRAMNCGAGGGVAIGVWQLLKYDLRHNIGLAVASTDQCSAAVFKAGPPGVAVADADLTTYSTGRGIRIGTSYARVLSTYGGSRISHGRHFVVAYYAEIPDTSMANPQKKIKLPETITLTIDDERVSSIAVYIDMSGEF